MINLSKAFRRELYYNRRNYLSYADITLSDGTVLNLTNTELWSGGFSVDDAVSDDNSFSALGSTIIGSATIVINNMDESYSDYDFTNAKVSLSVGMNLTEDGTTRTEKIQMGVYTVDGTSYNGGTITLTLLDNMEQFDRPYNGSSLSYPATLDEIVRDACTSCGVALNTYDFSHKDFTVQERPTDEAVTFREVVGWAAAIAGCFARCSRDGKLELKWFDQDTLENRNEGLDGGSFDASSPYSSGDTADGGVFSPWSDGDAADAGEFSEEKNIHYIHSLYSQDIAADDVVITGISVSVKNETESGSSATKTFTSGGSGYVIAVENNDFLTPDNAQEVAAWLGTQLIGLRFRKASVTHASNPAIEAGDIGILYDRKSRDYPILITRTAFSTSGTQTTVCGAETPSRNSATRYGWSTKAYVESRKMLNKEQSARELALKDLSSKLAAHSGLYSTVEQQESGGNIYYLHDMPTLDESSIVWKMTTEAWGVTTSYKGDDTVWNGGMTVDGDTIARILTATGVNADWVTTGTLRSKDGSNFINLDTGEMQISASTKVGGSTVASASDVSSSAESTLKSAKDYADGAASDAVEAQTQSSIFNKLTNNGETQGVYLKDGKLYINASYIATGTLADANENTTFDLSTGTLTMKKGSINIGNGNFVVDTSGNLTAKNAKLTGATVSGTITSTVGSQSLKISEALIRGYYGSAQYGLLDLCADYGDGSYRVSLKANNYLMVQFGREAHFEYTSGSGKLCMVVDGSTVTLYETLNMSNYSITNQSDKRLKSDIEKAKVDALEMVKSVPVVSFKWRKDGRKIAAGFIAQDVERAESECGYEGYSSLIHEDKEGYKGIATIEMLPILWKAVQELSKKIEQPGKET